MGFNMSWIFVDGIDQDALYAALDLTPTGGTPDRYDLGTRRVPWAGATTKSGWCAVFAKYSLVVDVAAGTDPPRLARLPATSRSVMCMVLEGPMISYASLWQDGRRTWQIQHDSSEGVQHLEAFGDLPPVFMDFREAAMEQQRADDKHREPGILRVDHVFDVPPQMAATLTGYRYDGRVEDDFFRNLQSLSPLNEIALTETSEPPRWWRQNQ
jgi:hypothetical protein